MKYANLLNTIAAVTILVTAMLKILHIGDGIVNGILTFAMVAALVGMEWKIKLLEKEISAYKAKEINP
ncbi:MAG TPA: hypothetical protein VFE57_10015 [Cyclobacteriaceae bacterium]|jgi:hypothetical protein|nr:hypothetical protein [Cyclobacteriaceae bacterium]